MACRTKRDAGAESLTRSAENKFRLLLNILVPEAGEIHEDDPDPWTF
jgi:hypothetical protein